MQFNGFLSQLEGIGSPGIAGRRCGCSGPADSACGRFVSGRCFCARDCDVLERLPGIRYHPGLSLTMEGRIGTSSMGNRRSSLTWFTTDQNRSTAGLWPGRQGFHQPLRSQFQVFCVDHRKTLCCDGETAWVRKTHPTSYCMTCDQVNSRSLCLRPGDLPTRIIPSRPCHKDLRKDLREVANGGLLNYYNPSRLSSEELSSSQKRM